MVMYGLLLLWLFGECLAVLLKWILIIVK